MYFPVADIEISPFIPPLVACVISFFTSMAGVSGAFLLLPFQVSILGFNTPAVSSTNHLFNIIAIPAGIYRFVKEGRMLWPLTWILILGTLPGLVAGIFIRIRYLPSPETFKLFVGFVLLYIGAKLWIDLLSTIHPSLNPTPPSAFKISDSKLSLKALDFTFNDEHFRVNTISLICLSILVGLIGGIYGVGGGAIIAPFLVTFYKLPIYTIAGASLMSTFITSAMGVAFFQLVSTATIVSGQQIAPDYRLGVLLGLGGIVGIYFGAKCQRFFPAKTIKTILAIILLTTSVKYIFFN